MDEHRARSAAARNGRTVIGGLALFAVPLLAVACGATASTSTVTPQASASASPGPTTELKIVVDEGTGKTDTWTLTCDPAGGSHPDPSAACAALAAKGRTALPPVPKGIMCSQLYGGAQTAKLTGSWDGKPVNASFSRQNGCEVSRWKALEGLLPATTGVGVG
jgi:hypothetical protein